MIDSHGRTITVTTAQGVDTYTVETGFTVSFPEGADATRALSTIEAMAPYVAPSAPTAFAPFDFLSLFTQTELAAILNSADSTVKIAIAKLQAIETYVDLTNQETIYLMEYLVLIGLMTSDRAARVLSGQQPN